MSLILNPIEHTHVNANRLKVFHGHRFPHASKHVPKTKCDMWHVNLWVNMWVVQVHEIANSTNASSEWTYFTCAPCWTPNATQTCKQSCFGDQCKQSCFNNTKVVNHLVNIMGLASTWSAKWQCDMWHVNLWVTSTPKRNHPSEAPSSCVPSQHRRSPTSQMQSAATT